MNISYDAARNFGLGFILLFLVLLGTIPNFMMQQVSTPVATNTAALNEMLIAVKIDDAFQNVQDEFNKLLSGVTDNEQIISNKIKEIQYHIDNFPSSHKNDHITEHKKAIDSLTELTKKFSFAVEIYKSEISIDPSADSTLMMGLLAEEIKEETKKNISIVLKDIHHDIHTNLLATTTVIKRMQKISGLVLLAGLIFGFAAFYFMVRSLNQPIDLLLEGTEKITRGDLSARVKILAGDKIGKLSLAFNNMAEALRKSVQHRKEAEKKLSEYSISLEEKVKERTLELEEEIIVRKEIEVNLKAAKNQISKEMEMIERANVSFKNLLKRSHDNIAERFDNKNLLQCWEEKKCGEKDCPCFQSDNLRCWQVVGTFCADQKNDDLIDKIRSCESCDVYAHATNSPISSIGEQFNNLMYILEVRAQELKEEREKAENASKIKSEFLANMSHEIRTPLNGIVGMSELAMDRCTDNDQKNFFIIINSEVNTLLDIINDILDFSKIESGKLEVEEIPFDLVSTLESISAVNAMTAEQKKLEFISFIHPDIPSKLVGDPGKLRQILMNLIGNAIKFTKEGEIFVEAKLLDDSGDKVTIHFQVTDTGIGISEKKQALIFESFTQADGSTTRKYGGTGLGTTICKQLVNIMDGEIGLESCEGKGSSFWFNLVLKKQTEKQKKIRPIEDDKLLGLHVLIVDDNHTNRSIVKAYFTTWGCNVSAVAGGKEALARIKESEESQNPYDLVFTDHHMPEMDGFELVETIRSDLKLTKIPIILFTSARSSGDSLRCREYGINGYLTKPIMRSELKCAIKTVLAGADYEETTESKDLITQHSLSKKSGKKMKRILLVEDYVTNQQVAIMHLQDAGYNVELAENGKQAVEAYSSKFYDAILMDVQMPEMDGYEATRIIRKYERKKGKRTPIIAMTAHATTEDKDRCLAAGMDDFMSKPLRRINLFNMLEKWLVPNYKAVYAPDAETESNQKAYPETNEKPPMDLNIALEEFRGDKELLMEVAEGFIESAKTRLNNISNALEKGDSEVIKGESHTLKGGAGMIWAEKLSQIGYDLEKSGKEKNLAKSAEILFSFRKEFDRLVSFVSDRQ